MEPRRIAGALSFHPVGNGSLAATLDRAKLAGVVDKLAPTEKPGQDARMDFSGGQPVVTPSSNGRVIDWDKTLAGFVAVITRPGERAADAVYVDTPAKVTAEDVKRLGIKEVIGEFTTGGFAQTPG